MMVFATNKPFIRGLSTNCTHYRPPSTALGRVLAPAVTAALVLLVALTGTVHGQTDYSLRMRTLGTAMSGVLDDAVFWSEGSGDGDAEFLIDDEYYGSMRRHIFNEIVRYL